jgi:6-phosphogluconolactonase
LSVDGGTLAYVASTATEQQPRGFRIDASGRFMVVSGEKSQTVSSYAIDEASGALSLVGRYPTGKGANWVEVVDFD